MKILIRAVYSVAGILVFAMITCLPVNAQKRIDNRFATVNGVRLHYLIAGKGDPVILLHGYAENSHMWRPLIPELAKAHTVIAPDLRGFGQSSKPMTGYDKKSMAQDVHALAQSLGYRHEVVVGHDIGLMVAYAYAAQYANEVDRIVLMDAFLPASVIGKPSGCLETSGTFTFTVKHRSSWLPDAKESTSSISGMILPPTRSIRCPRRIDSFTHDPMRSPARCAQDSKSSATSNRMQKTSRDSPKRN
jgi:pimeloyl-ACP methyl ester carboxylesterase